MIIHFTPAEVKSLELLAQGRHFLKDIVIPDRDLQRWNNSQHEADVLGVKGEYAVSKALKIPFDMSIGLEGDGGTTDMYLGEWRIQVKSTKYKNGRLVFNSLEEVDALIFVFVVIESKCATISGYIARNKALKKIYKKDLGHGIRFCIDQKELKPISDLLFYHLEHTLKK